VLNSPPTNRSVNPFSHKIRLPSQPDKALVAERRSRLGNGKRPPGHDAGGSGHAIHATVEIFPPGIATRRTFACHGLTAEIVQTTRRERIEYRFRAPLHMLAVYQQAVRGDGETVVEGVTRSRLRDLRKKLTFVPAGHEYCERHDLRTPSRVAYFYFDPAKLPVQSDLGSMNLAPRLYFEDATLWDSALKVTTLVESASTDNQLYLNALGVVLAHEIGRLDPNRSRVQRPIRGGLAAWQRRTVTAHIEEHLVEHISPATLAQLARLSPCHFCRAFKQSFGIPPHRYHIHRRIERAKELLAKPAPSVTDIALALGFSQISSFTAAFRRVTGLTPTAYHRSLG
jgi:AraC family transcriptional regulator